MRGARVRFAVLSVACAVALAPLVAPAARGATSTFNALLVKTAWQVADGDVFDIVRVGDVVVIGGSFTTLLSPDRSTTVTRDGLAALDARTGDLITGWNPGTDGTVQALVGSSDGRTVYVGGLFSEVGGVARNNVAAVDVATGAVVKAFKASTGGVVRAVALQGSRLYLGGKFTRVDGISRYRLAAVDAGTGALVTSFAAGPNGSVEALSFSPDGSRLYAAGKFTAIGGVARAFLAWVSPSSGAVSSWSPPAACTGGSKPCFLWDVTDDGTRVYGATGGPGGNVAAWSASSGSLLYRRHANGGVQSVDLWGGVLYAGGHWNLTYDGLPSAGLVAVDPASGHMTGSFQPRVIGGTAVWVVRADVDGLRIGGEFQRVDGKLRSGYAVFPPA